jgi:DNA uptake protein ComE-like DNA-binding protein
VSRLPRSSFFLRLKQGSALVAVIWALVFFAVLSVGITRVVSSQAMLLQRVEGWVLGEAAMRSACWQIRKEIQIRKEPYFSWADLMRDRDIELGVSHVRYHFIDEESRLDINMASQEQLAQIPGIGSDLAEKITASPLRPFFAKESLLWIDGFDTAAFEQSKDFVTVYSGGRVNINTAPVVVLQALGFEASLAADIDRIRKGPDGVAGTDDDKFFKDSVSVDAMMGSGLSMTDQEKAFMIGLFNAGDLGVDSDNFTVKASVDVLGKKVMDYDIVLNANKVVRWQEY